jgi:flagellar basal body-associated protein FliL
MNDGILRKTFATILIIGLSVLCIGFINHNKADINFSKISMKKTRQNDGYSRHVKYNVVLNIGERNFLKMEMAIPCENMEQSIDLNRKMEKIKNDILVSFDHKEMEEWVEQRDFEAIRSKYLKIINQHTDKPVKDLYFASFNLF